MKKILLFILFPFILFGQIQLGSDIDREAVNDWSGETVSLSDNGNIIAIRAPGNVGNGTDSGHVRVYDLSALLSSDDFALSKFSLFQNPTKNQFTIQLNKELELQKVNIYNNLGQFIDSTENRIINTLDFSAVIYYIEIITNKGKASKKLVIE